MSTASWLADAARVPLRDAKTSVRVAKRLEDAFHLTRRALAAAALNADQARVIIDAVDALPDFILGAERRAEVPWSRGGMTSVANGTLLCPRHRTVHRPGRSATYGSDGVTRIIRTVVRRQEERTSSIPPGLTGSAESSAPDGCPRHITLGSLIRAQPLMRIEARTVSSSARSSSD